MHRLLDSLATVVTQIPNRPSRLLQFLLGPPGHPGRYRVNPLAHFPPDTTDFLADEVRTFYPPPSGRHRHRPHRQPEVQSHSQRPLTVQRQLRGTFTTVSHLVYTFHSIDRTSSVQKRLTVSLHFDSFINLSLIHRWPPQRDTTYRGTRFPILLHRPLISQNFCCCPG